MYHRASLLLENFIVKEFREGSMEMYGTISSPRVLNLSIVALTTSLLRYSHFVKLTSRMPLLAIFMNLNNILAMQVTRRVYSVFHNNAKLSHFLPTVVI